MAASQLLLFVPRVPNPVLEVTTSWSLKWKAIGGDESFHEPFRQRIDAADGKSYQPGKSVEEFHWAMRAEGGGGGERER